MVSKVITDEIKAADDRMRQIILGKKVMFANIAVDMIQDNIITANTEETEGRNCIMSKNPIVRL